MPHKSLLILLLTGVVLFGILWTGNYASALELPNPLRCRDIPCLLRAIADFLLLVAIPILTIMVLWAGFLYLTAGGDPQRVQAAHKALLWAVIGFAIVLINWGIANIIEEILGGGNGGGPGPGPPGPE